MSVGERNGVKGDAPIADRRYHRGTAVERGIKGVGVPRIAIDPTIDGVPVQP